VKLEALPYYNYEGPSSLGREWLETNLLPLIVDNGASLEDILRTLVEHIAIRVAASIRLSGREMGASTLVTGGGVKNSFLLERISSLAGSEIVVPELLVVDFKEALIFALLGTLRWMGQVNTLASATGAVRDSCGGVICKV
jgi:anhydro-N-acetylmuramic acid kinase